MTDENKNENFEDDEIDSLGDLAVDPSSTNADLDSLAEDADPEDLIAAALAASAPAKVEEPESLLL